MLKIIGVRFKQADKIHYFDPLEFIIQKDDCVIVETSRGTEYGRIVKGIRFVKEDEVVLPLKSIIRIADDSDALKLEENKKLAKEALKICYEKALSQCVGMKLIDAEYTFNRNKIIFYFTADGRVDFRQLVRDLASIFRTRIELRQIGVRDEAKLLSGIGPCGRTLCCSSFLGDFAPVSIKMAKDQNLSLNPAKISGLCGRLMCCLKYENENYENIKKNVPDIGKYIETADGKGRISALDMLGQKMKVEMLDSAEIVEYSFEEFLSETGMQKVKN